MTFKHYDSLKYDVQLNWNMTRNNFPRLSWLRGVFVLMNEWQAENLNHIFGKLTLYWQTYAQLDPESTYWPLIIVFCQTITLLTFDSKERQLAMSKYPIQCDISCTSFRGLESYSSENESILYYNDEQLSLGC